MPKSDTWPCGSSTMETRTGMDSAGSCDSVVSRNSGFSDDSLEHLSAEEKACLMFLEETIESLDTGEDSGLSNESLDTEGDSGLSNDEPDRLPAPGNVASKTAHLSASMDNSRLHNASKHPCKQPIREVGKAAFGCLVPTPLVLANGSSGLLLPKSRAGLAPDKENSRPGARLSPSDPRSRQAPPRRGVPPSEVNVVVIPPPAKPRDPPGCWGSEGGAVCPRAPLTHEALVQLRKSASMKRVPDSPLAPGGPPKAHPWTRQPRGPSAAWPQDTLHHREPGGYSPSPPVVAPKPKRTPSDVSAASYPPLASSSPSERPLPDPQRARREALQKLGLLRENGPAETWPSAAAPPPGPSSEPHPHWEASPPRGGPSPLQEDDPPLSNPGGGRPFCYTRAPQNTGGALLRLHHHHGRHGDERPTPTTPREHPLRPDGAKAATLERSGVGLGSLAAEQAATASSSPQPRSASLGGGQRGGGYDPTAPEAAASPASLAQTAPQKQAAAGGFGVAAAPSMGADRREALRKLGLLKD